MKRTSQKNTISIFTMVQCIQRYLQELGHIYCNAWGKLSELLSNEEARRRKHKSLNIQRERHINAFLWFIRLMTIVTGDNLTVYIIQENHLVIKPLNILQAIPAGTQASLTHQESPLLSLHFRRAVFQPLDKGAHGIDLDCQFDGLNVPVKLALGLDLVFLRATSIEF